MFSPIALGTNHMLGQDTYVPLTTNNFEIRIYNMDGSTPSEFSELLTLSTHDIGAISENQDIIEVHYGNGIIKFPGKTTFNDVSWTLNCFCSPNVLGALRDWRQQVYNSTSEKMGLPSQYMRQVFFIRYDGQGNVRDALRAPGTWIANLDNGDMTQDGNSLVQVQVTLVISKVIYLTEAELQ